MKNTDKSRLVCAICITAALWIGCGALAGAQGGQKGDEGQILALENAWNQAELQHDPAALELILTDDFVITEPDGTMQSKREHMAAFVPLRCLGFGGLPGQSLWHGCRGDWNVP
jgi:hypothetical protein